MDKMHSFDSKSNHNYSLVLAALSSMEMAQPLVPVMGEAAAVLPFWCLLSSTMPFDEMAGDAKAGG